MSRTKGIWVVLLASLLVGFGACPRPANAWSWSSKVSLYGYAHQGPYMFSSGSGSCQTVQVYTPDGGTGTWKVPVRSGDGQWVLDGMPVNQRYSVRVWYQPIIFIIGGGGWQWSDWKTQYVTAPGVGYSVKMPDILVR